MRGAVTCFVPLRIHFRQTDKRCLNRKPKTFKLFKILKTENLKLKTFIRIREAQKKKKHVCVNFFSVRFFLSSVLIYSYLFFSILQR